MNEPGAQGEPFEIVLSEDYQPGNILTYDINAIPDNIGLDMEKIIYLFRSQGILFYDGNEHSGGNIPTITNIKDIDVQFVDVSRQQKQKLLNNYKLKLK